MTILDYFFPRYPDNKNSIHRYVSDKEINELTPFFKQLDAVQTRVLDGIFCCTQYKNELIKTLIHRVKLHGEWDIAKDLALILNHNLTGDMFDIITCVPPDPKRHRQRGFHLPYLLAKETAKLSNTRFLEVLHKNKHTPQQTGRNRQERLKNLDDTFEIHPKIIDNQTDLSEIKKVCIIDDVSTTGTTLYECAKYLRSLSDDLHIYGYVVAAEDD